MADYIIPFVTAARYLGIFLLIFVENVFPPIPSEFIMPLAGFTVYQGQLSFVGVVVPGIRSLISIPAGINRMSPAALLLYTRIGSTVWVLSLASAGYFLKSNFARVVHYLNPISHAIFALLIVVYIVRVVRHRQELRPFRNPPSLYYPV